MKRWNISNIFFLGVSAQLRNVCLEPDEVNIITGASGTGKSTLIKAIDYCLGSKRCELAAHVRRRSIAVGVKWVAGDDEMIIGRIIPPVGQGTSTRMFTTSGRNLALPSTLADFDGATTVDAAKSFIERAFGIGDLPGEADAGGNVRGRATVRLVTPYLFLTKDVIYSETVLLHGLEVADKARDIVASMPYFLGATDESTAIDERQLRQLQRGLDREEARLKSRTAADSALKTRALGLLSEARRAGLIAVDTASDSSEDALLVHLKLAADAELGSDPYPNESELGAPHVQRRSVLDALDVARRRAVASRSAIREAAGFQTAVSRQREKLMLADHLHLSDVSGVCPVCDTPSELGREAARALQATLTKVRDESAAVDRVRPKLVEYDRGLSDEIGRLNRDLREVDEQIRGWVRQTEETRRLASLGQFRAHIIGRISLFLESTLDEPRLPARDLSVLRTQIAELEGRVDREAKEIKLRRAEAKISEFASDVFKVLPTVDPCVGSDLDFSSRKPEVSVIEADGGAILRMPDVGSDQNYLAIHIALSFALQRYFEQIQAPVPGLLVLDQVSRPYFPARVEDADEQEIEGGEEDEDIQAMRRHINFLFAETARRKGLQVLLIEHAYFADDPRYVAATRERWTRASRNALIPFDWPVRAD